MGEKAFIAPGDLSLHVTITDEGGLNARVEDPHVGDEYLLHLVPNATGDYVGRVRYEYDLALEQIWKDCFTLSVFHGTQTLALIDYARSQWGDNLEFLWQNFPDYAVLRRPDSHKWYAIILILPQNKLRGTSRDPLEVIDLRLPLEERETLIDHQRYYPGYHMNKKSWYTIALDGTVTLDELLGRLKKSRDLAK